VTAAATIASVRKARPLVAALARALSLATTVDVRLVRTMRRDLFENADVTTEADLWTSPLVQSRSAAELVLRPDVQDELRRELGEQENRAELERCYAKLKELRSAGRPLQVLEERLAYLAILDEREKIEEELGSVVKAMVDDPSRRRDLAAWSARALARLPETFRKGDHAQVLATAAAGWVATPIQLASVAPSAKNARIANRLLPQGYLTEVWIRRVGNLLEVGPSSSLEAVKLALPVSDPTLIIDDDRVIRLDVSRVTTIAVATAEVMLGSSEGRRWLLGPKQRVPNVQAVEWVAVRSGRAAGRAAGYLVRPDIVVASAREITLGDHGNLRGSISFGGDVIGAHAIVLDEDSDVALLRLSRPPHILPLELELEPQVGQIWQAFGLPTGSVSERGPTTPGQRKGRWTGTVASIGAELTLRCPDDELPEGVTRPGMPIFFNHKVIGHLDGRRRRDGVLRATPAHVVQQWLERVDARTSQTSRTIALVVCSPTSEIARKARERLESLSTPALTLRVVSSSVGDIEMADVEAAVRMRQPEAFAIMNAVLRETGSIHNVEVFAGALGLFEDNAGLVRARTVSEIDAACEYTVKALAAGLEARVRDQLRISPDETLGPRRKSMLIAISIERAGGELLRRASADAVAIRACTSLDDAIDAVRRDFGLAADVAAAPQLPRVWIHSLRTEEVPVPLDFTGAPGIQKNNLVLLFIGEGSSRRPGALYRITGGRRTTQGLPTSATSTPTSVSGRAELVLRFEPFNTVAHLEEIAWVADSTSRDTRNLNIHDRVVDLLLSVLPGSQGAQVIRFLGPSRRLTSIRTAEVQLALSENVALDGLVSPILEERGDIVRVGRYRWYEHPITLVPSGQQPLASPEVLRVAIRDEQVPALGRMMQLTLPAVSSNPSLVTAFEDLPRLLAARIETVRVPTSMYDAELVVFRLPNQTKATALRAGVEFVIGVLDWVDHPGFDRTRLHLEIPGSGDRDLREAQDALQALAEGEPYSILSIDPETHIVTAMLPPVTTQEEFAVQLDRVGAALQGHVERELFRGDAIDLVAHRFGSSDVRGGRRLAIDLSETAATITISQTDRRPVRGYVSFYSSRDDRSIRHERVAASGGVVSYRLPRPRLDATAIGAIVEDEGVMLEGAVDGNVTETMNALKNKLGASLAAEDAITILETVRRLPERARRAVMLSIRLNDNHVIEGPVDRLVNGVYLLDTATRPGVQVRGEDINALEIVSVRAW
jgi:hypothetical protein